MKGFSY